MVSVDVARILKAVEGPPREAHVDRDNLFHLGGTHHASQGRWFPPDTHRILAKFNHHHGDHGLFSSGDGGGGGVAVLDRPTVAPMSAVAHQHLVDAVGAERAEHLAAAWHGFSHNGLTTRIGAVTPGGGGTVIVAGHITDETGKPVGNFNRIIHGPDEAETLGIGLSHASLFMDEGHQGTGFAKAWLGHCFHQYRAAGYDKVGVGTADVGSYAWARLGARPLTNDSGYGEGQPKAQQRVWQNIAGVEGSYHQDLHIDNTGSFAHAIDQVMALPHDTALRIMRNTGWNGVFDLTTNPLAKALGTADETDDELWDATVDWVTKLAKFNPYHDGSGRFASRDGATSTSFRGTRLPHNQALAEGARSYATAKGLVTAGTPDPNFARIRAIPAARRQAVADAYTAAQPDAHSAAAYHQLATEVRSQYRYLTGKMGVKVSVVAHDPYPNVAAMVHDVTANHHLAVLSTKSTGGHPVLSNRENDMFRAVHDAFGHAATGRAFDRDGEEAAYQAHKLMFSDLASEALATETRGQNCYLITHGEFPPQKAIVLPAELRKYNHHHGEAGRFATADGGGAPVNPEATSPQAQAFGRTLGEATARAAGVWGKNVDPLSPDKGSEGLAQEADYRYHTGAGRVAKLWQQYSGGYLLTRQAAQNVLDGKPALSSDLSDVIDGKITRYTPTTTMELGLPGTERFVEQMALTRSGYARSDMKADVAAAGHHVAERLITAPPSKTRLYRGIVGKDGDGNGIPDKYQTVGQHFTLRPSSFTPDHDVANNYAATHRAQANDRSLVATQIVLDPGARAYDVTADSPSSFHAESIVGGEFEVTAAGEGYISIRQVHNVVQKSADLPDYSEDFDTPIAPQPLPTSTDVTKYNHHHGEHGLFATADGGSSGDGPSGDVLQVTPAVAAMRAGGGTVGNDPDAVAAHIKASYPNVAVSGVSTFAPSSSLAPHTAIRVAHVVSTLASRFPEVPTQKISCATTETMNTMGRYAEHYGGGADNWLDGGTHRIVCNPMYFGDTPGMNTLSANVRQDVSYGFHPSSLKGVDPVVAIISHEYGHAVSSALGRRSKTILDLTQADAGFGTTPMDRHEFKVSVSGYSKKNSEECFAELFSEAYASPHPRPVALSFRGHLERMWSAQLTGGQTKFGPWDPDSLFARV